MPIKRKGGWLTISKGLHIFALCILLGNVFVNSFRSNFVTYELDRKLIYFNTFGSIYITLAIILRLRKKITLSYFDVYLILFTVYISLNYYLSIGWYNNTLASILLLVLIFISIKDLAYTHHCKDALLFWITFCFLVIGIFEATIGILQLFRITPGLGKNILGTFFNTGVYAIYISISCAFALSRYVFCQATTFKKKLLKNLALVNIAICIIVLPSTYSRSAWLATLCSLIFVILIKYKQTLSKINFRTKLLSGLVLASLGIALAFGGYKLKSASADGRIVIWKTGLIALKENPLFGIGFGQIPYRFFEYQAEYFSKDPKAGEKYTDKVDFAFNDLLQFTVENGIAGLLLVVIGVVIFYKSINPKWKRDPFFISAVSGTLAIAVSGLFSYPLAMISFQYLAVLFLSVITISVGALKEKIILNGTVAIFAYASVLVCCSYILYQQHRCHTSLALIEKGQESIESQNFKAAKTYFQIALENTPYQKKILPLYALSQLNLKDYEGSIQSFSRAQKYISDPFLFANTGNACLRLKRYKQAEHQYLNAVRMAPNRMYFKYLLAKLFKETGDSLKLRHISHEILTMPIKVESLAIQQMKSEIRNLIKP